MIFTEFRFFAFFAIALLVYWLLRSNSLRKAWLLACSYFFYGCWDWRFLSLIWFSTIVDYGVGIALDRSENDKTRRQLLLVSLVVNLGLLAVFKYLNFFLDSVSDALNLFGLPTGGATLDIVLPVGISFYTFQTLSYSIDIYLRRLKATTRFLDFALFVAFFPQLVAGPIVRARDFIYQLETNRDASKVRWRIVATLFLIGFIKKACISDNLAIYVDHFFSAPELYAGSSAILATALYAIQIYCDFSGYSDMAIAVAACFGYELCRNFAHPYFATHIGTFWRRWHISLSSWLRDYLYIPLGGNRYGLVNACRNLMITMVLGGIWHGATWTFVVWGALHGFALIAFRVWSELTGKRSKNGVTASIASWLLTQYWVGLCWIFFRATTFEQAICIARKYLWLDHSGGEQLPAVLWLYTVVLALAHYATYRWNLESAVSRQPWIVTIVILAVVSAVCLAIVPVGNRPFIYFQF